jgi:hypothetical protein
MKARDRICPVKNDFAELFGFAASFAMLIPVAWRLLEMLRSVSNQTHGTP